MSRPEEIEGDEVPLHVALTQPILMGGAPRTFAILNGTVALVVGMGLHLWWLGFPAGAALHMAAVLMSKRTLHEVGQAMIKSAIGGYPKQILEVKDIVALANA